MILGIKFSGACVSRPPGINVGARTGNRCGPVKQPERGSAAAHRRAAAAHPTVAFNKEALSNVHRKQVMPHGPARRTGDAVRAGHRRPDPSGRSLRQAGPAHRPLQRRRRHGHLDPHDGSVPGEVPAGQPEGAHRQQAGRRQHHRRQLFRRKGDERWDLDIRAVHVDGF